MAINKEQVTAQWDRIIADMKKYNASEKAIGLARQAKDGVNNV